MIRVGHLDIGCDKFYRACVKMLVNLSVTRYAIPYYPVYSTSMTDKLLRPTPHKHASRS